MELNCWEQRAVSPAMAQCSCQHGLKQDFNAACGTLGLQDRAGNKCRRGRTVCAVRSTDKHHSSSMQQQRLVVKDGNDSSPLCFPSFHFILVIFVYLSSRPQSLSWCSFFSPPHSSHIHLPDLTFSSVCKIITATIITDYTEGRGERECTHIKQLFIRSVQ